MSRHCGGTENHKFLAVSPQLKLQVSTFFLTQKYYNYVLPVEFCEISWSLAPVSCSGSPLESDGPCESIMALPALLLTRNQDGVFVSSDCAMFTLLFHGGGAGRVIFGILTEVQACNKGYQLFFVE